jgi:Integral membrane protein TerC family
MFDPRQASIGLGENRSGLTLENVSTPYHDGMRPGALKHAPAKNHGERENCGFVTLSNLAFINVLPTLPKHTSGHRGLRMQDIMILVQDPAAWVALVTLVVMEIVLGIDNLIFISILTNKLPPEHRERARKIGIGLALLMRLALLGTIPGRI